MLKTFLLVFFCLCVTVSAWSAEPVLRNVSAPVGIIQSADGEIYVSEWGANRITAFTKDGHRRALIEGIPNPAGLAFGPDNELYVAGYGDGRIYAWYRNGGLRELAAGFSSPTGILWDAISGALLVANRNAGEVIKLYQDGRRELLSSGHKLPVGIARASNGDLYVSCYGGTVDVLDSSGEKIISRKDLVQPGVGMAAKGNDVFAVDHAAGTVARLYSDGSQIVCKNLQSPVALAALKDGSLLIGAWGDNAIYEARPN